MSMKTVKSRLLLQAGMSSIRSVEREPDALDIIGVCKLEHVIVRRKVYKNGDIYEWNDGAKRWLLLDMVGKGFQRIAVLSQGRMA